MTFEDILAQYSEEHLRRIQRDKAADPITRGDFERLVERVDQLIEELDELRMQLEGDEA